MSNLAITPIAPTDLATFMVMERAVHYARVSGDDRKNDGRNLEEGQLQLCREHSARKNYRVVAEFSEDDRGASGYEIDLPKLNQIREMGRAGEFDILIVRELDRLSRNLAKQLIIEEELRRYGVRVEYVLAEYDDTAEGRFQKHIRATVAEYEREKIKERMVRGRRLSVKSGNVIVSGRPPYGYRLTQRNGKATLEVVTDEARIIRLIFEWYVIGDETKVRLSIRGITKKLTSMKIPTPYDNQRMSKKRGKGEWSFSTVKAILKNETYAGVWHYGKRDRNQRRNPDSHLIAIEVEPIVPRELWEVVQARFAESKQNSRGNVKYKYLFRKRCTCGDCGYKMIGMSTDKGKLLYYRCPAKKDLLHFRKCNSPHFRADHVDATVWNWLESIFEDQVGLSKSLADYQASREQVSEPIKAQLEAAQSSIKNYNNDLKGLVKDLKLLKGPNTSRTKAAILNDIEQVEKALDSLEAQRAQLARQLEAQSLTPERIKSIKEHAFTVSQDLETFKHDFEGRRRFIELLDVKIKLIVEEGQKVVYVSCYLGNERLPIVSNTTFYITHDTQAPSSIVSNTICANV